MCRWCYEFSVHYYIKETQVSLNPATLQSEPEVESYRQHPL